MLCVFVFRQAFKQDTVNAAPKQATVADAPNENSILPAKILRQVLTSDCKLFA